MGDLGSTPLLYAARPQLALDGRAEEGLAVGLMSLAVTETTEGLYRCEAAFGNWGPVGGGIGFLYFDRQVLEFGRRLSVDGGAGAAAARLFEGRITGLEGRFPQGRPPELLVLAEDRFQDLRMVRRSRSFEDVTDRDVFDRIAGQHGLTADIDVDGGGPTHRLLAQVNQSDLAFLRERARAVDAELWLDGDTLHVQARSRRRHAEVTLTYGQGLLELSVLADVAQQRTRLTVSGWDVQAKEGIERDGDDSHVQGELDGGASGGAVLADRFGERPERIVHLVPLSSQEAQQLAEASYRRMARRFVTGQGIAEGDARIRAGTHLRLQGLGALFDGRYYVTEVRHTYDLVSGLRTCFRVERPGLGGGQG